MSLPVYKRSYVRRLKLGEVGYGKKKTWHYLSFKGCHFSLFCNLSVLDVITAKMERQRRNLSRDECVMATTLIQEGLSFRAVSRRLGVSHSTILRMFRRFEETNDHIRRRGQGRPRGTTAIHDRFLQLNALRQRFVTSRHLQVQLSTTHNIHVSMSTVRRRLAERNLSFRIPARGPRLNANHVRARLQFAREHVNWAVEDWERVLFTDETRFCLYSNDRRVRVIRRPYERYSQCNIRQTELFNGGSVLFWGGISLRARTDIVSLRGAPLNSDRYITDILSEHVVPFAGYIGDNFILMHDNARPHVARIVQNYLNEVNIETLDWPPRSPDLNPIEHLWDYVGRQLRNHQPLPASMDDVEYIVRDIWDNIDQDLIRRLVSSMSHRCQAVIRSRGGNTRY